MKKNIIAEPKQWWRFNAHCFILDGPPDDFWRALQMVRDNWGDRYNIRVTEEGDFSVAGSRFVTHMNFHYLSKPE